MEIRLKVHLEPVGEDGWVWWGDSDEVPGFTAAADHLNEMLERARSALLAEGLLDSDSELTTVLMPAERPSEPAALNEAPSDQTLTSGPERREALNTRTLVSA